MLKEDLSGVAKGEISDAAADLNKFSEDASIFHVAPKLIVRPENAADVSNIVKYVASRKAADPTISLTARAAGTDMSGGPLNTSVILDFMAHMNHVVEVGEGYALTEPGVFYRDFEKETLKTGQIMPSYPASRELCAMGGIVANNSGGEKSLSYGKTENYVEEVDVILSDGSPVTLKALTPEELKRKMTQEDLEGSIYRGMYELLETNYDLIHDAKPKVSKNSAGYFLWNVWDRKTFNLAKLFVGSQGTLGMWTRAKIKLVRVKPKSELLVMFLNDLGHLGEIVDAIVPYHPESFESYDDKTFKLAMKFFPALLKRMKGNLFKLGWQFLPEMWMTLTGGVPNLVLIAEFTGDTEDEVFTKIRVVEKTVRERFGVKTHITKDRNETLKYWVMRRESFSLLREHVHGKHTAPFIDDIVVQPHCLPEFLPKLNAILEPYKNQLLYTIAGHAGDGNFHIIPLMDFHDQKSRDCIIEVSEKVYSLVAEYHGSIDGEHNDGIVRTPYLEKMYGSRIVGFFKRTKEIWDPQNIFNPGKKVGGDVQNLVRLMKKD
jgi:FAD/FMN-containing dehydrogenase